MAAAADIRTGLATVLRDAYPDYQVSGYVLSSPTAPAFEIDLDPEGINYDEAAARGHDEWWWIVRGFVSTVSDVGAQDQRDEMLRSSGGRSVKEVLEQDSTLGGACFDMRVVTGVPRSFDIENTFYLGAEWRVQVWAVG